MDILKLELIKTCWHEMWENNESMIISKIYPDEKRNCHLLIWETLEEADFSKEYPFSYGDVRFRSILEVQVAMHR